MALISAILLIAQPSPAQQVQGSGHRRIGAAQVISIDGTPVYNGSCSSSPCSVAAFTPTAGDGIVCAFSVKNNGTFTSISDNVNSGNYVSAIGPTNSGASNNYVGIYYKAGVSGSSTTVSIAFSAGASGATLGCFALKPTVSGTMTLDSAFVQQQTQTGVANPTTGTAILPSNNAEMIMGALSNPSGSPTAGTNYTLISQISFPHVEYWFQGSATATNAPFTFAASNWTDQQVAFYFH